MRAIKKTPFCNKMQKRATKLVKDCKNLNYNSRLKVLGLSTLENRWDRGDMIQLFKMVKGIDRVDYSKFVQLVNCSKTRGHHLKLVKTGCRLELRRNFFSQRVIDKWNSLPEFAVEADSVNSFKNSLDKYSSLKRV